MSTSKKPEQKAVRLPVKSAHVETFQPMLRSMQAKDELNDVLKNRAAKACTLLDEGVPLFPNTFSRDTSISTLLEQYGKAQEDILEGMPDVFALAGRIILHRSFGKMTFFHIRDQTGSMQVYAARDELGKEHYTLFKKYDIGDIVGVRGTLFRTQKGELTLRAQEVHLVTKSMRPLPHKHEGLKNVELRYRQRYVDLIVTDRTREIFIKRTQIIREFRTFMEQEGFMEVETPMMQPLPGGATAKPFQTHHSALDFTLYMRIAPELYLKRLLVGGFEKVFEINRNFRNEGISTRHNPEFTMCEFYWSYATYVDLMDLTERLFAHIARAVCGDTVIEYQGNAIDLSVGKWTRMTFHKALETIGGIAPEVYCEYDRAATRVRQAGEKVIKGEVLGKVQAKLFDLFVEPKLIQPHFIYHYPTDISPLSRKNEDNPAITDRFELFMTGREMANAFSELNDPVDQRLRFEAQMREKEAGDEEAHGMDDDYIRALEYGMPPAAGEGVGIDRLVMLLTDCASIREVILFPLLRPEYSTQTESR